MEHLDNDMDDLFQKAGELYPLKISGSDWETVAAKLQDQNFEDLNAVTGLSANGTGNKRRWRLLLLLIPLGLAGLVFFTGKLNRHPGSSETNTSKINPAGRAEEIKSNPAVNEEQTNSAPVKPSTENKTIKEDKKLNSERPGQPAYAKSKTGDVKNLDRTRNPVAFDNREKPGKNPSDTNYSSNTDNLSNTESANETTAGIVAAPFISSNETAPAKRDSATNSESAAPEKSKPVAQENSLKKKTSGTDSKSFKGFYALAWVQLSDTGLINIWPLKRAFSGIKNITIQRGNILKIRKSIFQQTSILMAIVICWKSQLISAMILHPKKITVFLQRPDYHLMSR